MSDPLNQNGPPDAPASIRVLFLVGRLEPTAPCRAAVGLAYRLRKLGHAVEMVCRSGSLAHVHTRAGADRAVEYAPPVWISRSLGRSLRSRLSLGTLVARAREMEPDLLHVHGAALAGVGARLARRLRTPYVLAIDDFLDPGQSLPRSRRFLRKIIVASDAVRVDLVNRLALPRELITVVPEGVDLADYPDRKPGLGTFAIPVVGTIGRLVESKGQELFVRAAHLLAMRGRHAHFVIAGEGPDRKRVQNLVAELELIDRLTFARAPVDQLDVLKALDIFVMPALREALGLPVIEAMASGIPVIATSAGGIFSLIENKKTGVLVQKKDPDALAREIENLLDRPDLAAQLARAAKERVAQQFTIETVAERISRVYDDVVGVAAEETTVTAS